MQIRLQEVQTHAIAAIVEDTEQFIEANFYDESPMELTGSATLLGVLNHMVIRGQFISLIVSFLKLRNCLIDLHINK